MLLIPFIENAFKHLSNFTDQQNIVKVIMARQFNKLVCTVFNTTSAAIKKNAEGIGLKNVRRRLELLYPARHELRVNEQPFSFEVTLTIILQ